MIGLDWDCFVTFCKYYITLVYNRLAKLKKKLNARQIQY